MAYEYRFEGYDFHWAEEQQAKVDAMAQAGWRVHTASATYPEVSILWERETVNTEVDPPKSPAKQEKKGSGDR